MTESDKQDLEDFEGMCVRVDAIDPEAAAFLRKLATAWDPETMETGGLISGPFSPDSGLSKCFPWDCTPFRLRRWANIHEKIGGTFA